MFYDGKIHNNVRTERRISVDFSIHYSEEPIRYSSERSRHRVCSDRCVLESASCSRVLPGKRAVVILGEAAKLVVRRRVELDFLTCRDRLIRTEIEFD